KSAIIGSRMPPRRRRSGIRPRFLRWPRPTCSVIWRARTGKWPRWAETALRTCGLFGDNAFLTSTRGVPMTTPGDMSMTAPQPSPGVPEAKLMLRSLWKGSGASDDLVPMLYGSPGSGRPSLIREVAQELGFERVVMIRTPELAPEDVTGFALPHADGPSRFHPSAESLRLTRE